MNLADMKGWQDEMDSLALSDRREKAIEQVKKGDFDTQKKINDILINYLSSDNFYKILLTQRRSLILILIIES